MHFYVFDLNFNLVGIIKRYDIVTIQHNYLAHSILEFELAAHQEADEFTNKTNYNEVRSQIIEMLFTQTARDEGRIICKASDLTHGYFIRTELYDDGVSEDDEKLKFTAFSLTYLLKSRTIPTQQVFNGNIEDAMRYYVNINCIAPANPNRIIKDLILSDTLQGININVNVSYAKTFLDESLYELGIPHDVSYDVLMDYENKKYVFVPYQGIDRTDLQDVNTPVILAKDYGNVDSETFTDDRSSAKTTALVVGYYEEALEPYEMYVYTNDDKIGLDRWEVFVDARDVLSIYTGDDDVDYSMTERQYENVLKQKGDTALNEYKRMQTFESTINSEVDFVFGVDYRLGDIIASKNKELGIIMRRRVVQAVETFTNNGKAYDYQLIHSFGDSILEFTDALKRELKHR